MVVRRDDMDIEIKNKLNRMAVYKDKFKDVFPWDNGVIKYIAAIIYSGMGEEIDIDRLNEMKKLINDNTKRFSAFRNSFQPLLAILLSFEKEPKELFFRMKDIAQLFKQEKIVNNAYTAAACYYIATNADGADYQKIVTCFKQLYKGIKKEYPLITGVDDYMYFAIMAIQGLDVSGTIERIITISEQLQVCGMKKNELQALALTVLLMEHDDENLLQKVIVMNDTLKDKGVSLNSFGISASIAVLAELDEEGCSIVDVFLETVEYIKTLDGYSDAYIDDVMRNIIAILFLTYRSSRKDLVETQTLCYLVLMMSCSSTTLLL